MIAINKTQFFILLLIGLGLIVYAGYFVFQEISQAQSLYIEKQKELAGLENKQKQIAHLREELEKISENKAEVLASLIVRDDALKVIERIEDVARKGGLLHEVNLLGEVTKEGIDRELLAIRRSRSGGKEEAMEAVLNKLPNISFQVNLTGDYSGIIRFLEGIGTLPYYTQIEQFELAGKKPKIVGEAGEGAEKISAIEAKINLSVFTR